MSYAICHFVFIYDCTHKFFLSRLTNYMLTIHILYMCVGTRNLRLDSVELRFETRHKVR